MRLTLIVLALMHLSIACHGLDTVSNHEENWDFYLCNVNNVIGSVFLDLGYRRVAPIEAYGHLLSLSVLMQHPSPNGLSSDEESGTLGSIEDELVPYVTEKFSALFVGRLTTARRRDFYFYMQSSNVRDRDLRVPLSHFRSYKYAFEVKDDSNWSFYLDFLYPNPKQFQSIQNRRVVETLEKNGDSLLKARRVDHWIYFKTGKELQEFLNRSKTLGFSVQSQGRIDSKDNWKYQAQIYRTDYVDYPRINEVALQLYDLANQNGGDYDGWETSVEK